MRGVVAGLKKRQFVCIAVVFRSAALSIIVPAVCAAEPSIEESPPSFSVGDTWQYSFQDLIDRGHPADLNSEWVTGLNPDGSVDIGRVRSGKSVPVRLDANGNYVDLYDWHFRPSLSYLAFPLFVGRNWRSEYRWTAPGGGTGTANATASVVSLDHIKVKAGEFDAFKIEVFCQSRTDTSPWITEVRSQVWYAPNVKRIVLRISSEEQGYRHSSEWRQELVRYSLVPIDRASFGAASAAASAVAQPAPLR